MPSMLPGFEYDIFISYRQKDNKGDHWVTKFVKALKAELEATFKDDVSIYFDQSPHDGILEMYDVDDSLKDKLKCIVFIPIISQTYCDPKSFAWNHEFLAFKKLALEDQFGLKVKLLNGNVISRILPVKIHDLDVEDQMQLETELSGALRAVEFVYRELGVNRPLKVDDQEKKNLNETRYRNQINKVANAVKEIITALKSPGIRMPVPTKETHGRPSTTSKTISKKRVALAAMSLVILLAVGYGVSRFTSTTEEHEVLEKSIAVLPFVNMSNDPNQEYFSDGLSEELLNLLSKVPELKVIGRTSSFSFKGKNEDLRIIGDKLGVAHILEGSVQKEGNKVRVTAQLIRTADGFHLWADKYDRDLEGIFKLQDEIAGAVVKQLKLKLLATTAKTTSSSINTEVYNLILQGNYFAEKRDKENLDRALDFYLKALALDSLNARSWAALAKCYSLEASWQRTDERQGFEKARKAAIKSIELDDAQAEGHYVLGAVKMFEFDWDAAEAEYQKALDLEPSNVDVLRVTGFLYQCKGRFDDAVRFTRMSISLDPVKAITHSTLGQHLYYANHFEEAIASFKKALELDPQFPRAHIFLGEIYFLQGKLEMARAEMSQEANEAWRNFGLILTSQEAGRKKEVDKLLSDYIARFQNGNTYQIATIYAFQGEKDKAFEYLEKAYSRKDRRLVYFKDDPLLKNLEGDPRHTAFLKKMKLPF